jgi:hypothetical protein
VRKFVGCFFGLLLLAGLARAADSKGKVILDLWDAAYMKGGKAGYVRTTVVEMRRGEEKAFRTTLELNLTLNRNGDPVNLRSETGSEETADGKVTSVFMRQYLGKQQQLSVTGTVSGKKVHLQLTGKGGMKWTAPWNDKVVGMYRQQLLFKERKVKPGDKFEFFSFEPSVNLVIAIRVRVKDFEEVTLPGGKVKKKLLRVDLIPEELKVTNAKGEPDKFTLPNLTYWLGKDLVPVRWRTEAPGLGAIDAYRTTRAVALAKGSLPTFDLGLSQLVRLNKPIPRPFACSSAVYRIRVKGDKKASSAFAQDDRQVIKNAKGDTFELHVQARRGPGAAKEGEVKGEYLKSSYFINCDDAKVKELARSAVGREKDPWKKALRIETWVRKHMKIVQDEGLATADHVARTLEGDCTEFAMLAAAMCRAQGIPSKTVFGLMYTHDPRKPSMGFHMWTEVWVKGQWVPIDAMVGMGYVPADHIKISEHSWYNRRDLVPLLPVLRVLGKLSIEVVRVSG